MFITSSFASFVPLY